MESFTADNGVVFKVGDAVRNYNKGTECVGIIVSINKRSASVMYKGENKASNTPWNQLMIISIDAGITDTSNSAAALQENNLPESISGSVITAS